MDDELCTYERCLVPYERFRRWSETVNEIISRGGDYEDLTKLQLSLQVIQNNPVQDTVDGRVIDLATNDMRMVAIWKRYDPQNLKDELERRLDTPQQLRNQ